MKFRLMLGVLFLALAPAALASNTWYVDGVNGNDSNNCTSTTTACKTIGHAISLASLGDSIIVAAATYKENLTISFGLTITGASAATTIIDGGAAAPVVVIKAGNVTLTGLTIQNGLNELTGPCSGQGGGICGATGWSLVIVNSVISGNTAVSGGGVYQEAGSLTINQTTISSNRAGQEGGGIFSNGAGLAVTNSTIAQNSVSAGVGGGIAETGTTYITNSTIARNTASVGTSTATYAGQGGGIFLGAQNGGGGRLLIASSTIADNSANASSNSGGGIYIVDGFAIGYVQNTIVANNLGTANCSGSSAITTTSYNLSSDNSCNFTGPGNLNDTDPKLGLLQNNGGPTQTMALAPDSRAVDTGNPSGCTDWHGTLLVRDQRGAPRPDKDDTGVGCDIGAYERQD